MVARLRTFTLATLAFFAANAAKAADYSPPPPPVMVAQPVPQFASGWYLRGNVGAGINSNVQLDYLKNPANPPNNFHFENKSIADTFFIGGGAGYEFNNWLRFDGTVEYRTKSRVYAIGSYTPAAARSSTLTRAI